MSFQPPSLADQVARLRASATGTPAPIWLPDALHAAIMALLARIFGRLEAMIQLWQAGLLPPPTPRTTTASTKRHELATFTPRQNSVRRRAEFASSRSLVAPAPSHATATPRATPPMHPDVGRAKRPVPTLPPLRPRLLHGPPCAAACVANRPFLPTGTCAYFIPYS